jgi:hypothetical protein
MENHSKFNAARRNGAPPAKRSPVRKALSSEASFEHWLDLQKVLQYLPDSRPEAVARARRMIADNDYPPKHKQRILARQFAVRLTAESDTFPT